MEKRKLKLEEIKVESFITTIEGMKLAGGSYHTDSCASCPCSTFPNDNTCVATCISSCATCVPACSGGSGTGDTTVSYC